MCKLCIINSDYLMQIRLDCVRMNCDLYEFTHTKPQTISNPNWSKLVSQSQTDTSSVKAA